MSVTKNIKQASVKKFAHATVDKSSTIYSDGYRSYLPALEEYMKSAGAPRVFAEGCLFTGKKYSEDSAFY